MMKSLTAGVCVLALTTTLAFAQGSMPQGGANQSPMNPTSETSKEGAMNKGSTSGMSNTDKSMKKDMKKDNMMKTDKDGMKK